MSTIDSYPTKAGKRYAVRYRRPDGKQTMKRGFTRKADAQRWEAENTVAMTRGAYVAPAAGRLSFESAAEEWISTRHDLAPSTLARYRGLVDQLNKRFGTLPLSKMTRPLLREWVAELVDAETPAETVHKTVGVVRQVLQHAVDDQRLAANPADNLALPPIRPTEMRFLTLDQLRRLAAAAGHDGAAIWMLGICGLRMGELVGLQHQDIDRQAGTLHVVRMLAVPIRLIAVAVAALRHQRIQKCTQHHHLVSNSGIGPSEKSPMAEGGLGVGVGGHSPWVGVCAGQGHHWRSGSRGGGVTALSLLLLR